MTSTSEPNFHPSHTQQQYQPQPPAAKAATTYAASFSSPAPAKTAHHHHSHQSKPPSLTAKIIESLRRNNLKVIAFDFDCTIVSIHTGGTWFDSAEKLAEFVLKCPDFFVCVATYSPQEDLIREVLRLTMRDEYAV